MKRIASTLVFTTLLLVFGVVFTAPPARAGSPHFIGSCTATFDQSTGVLTVTAKEAGLGGETIDASYTVTAQCQNSGGNNPKAGNKQTFSASGSFTVSNGKADISLSTDIVFSPDCSPPMSIVFTTPVTLTDTTNGISTTCTVTTVP
jgi:hypothetical protein